MLKFKFFVSPDKYSRISQIFLKSANVNHNWKTEKCSLKIGTPFGTLVPIWKIGMALARWHSKLKNWHVYSTLARGHVDHADTHGTYGTQFSKLSLHYQLKIV